MVAALEDQGIVGFFVILGVAYVALVIKIFKRNHFLIIITFKFVIKISSNYVIMQIKVYFKITKFRRQVKLI